MTKKTLFVLGALALVGVILAVLATRGQPRLEATDQVGQPLFPRLVNDIEKLRSLVIKHGGETMTIDWDDKGKVFEVVIQTGAMLAIVWEYRARFGRARLARAPRRDPGPASDRAR